MHVMHVIACNAITCNYMHCNVYASGGTQLPGILSALGAVAIFVLF